MKLMTYNSPLSTFESFFGDPFEAFAPLFETSRSRSSSSVEWFEDDSNYYARLDLPGVKKENLKLEFESDVITLAILAPDSDGESNQYTKKLRLTEDVDAEAAGAKLEDGVLTLTIPKAPVKDPVTIEIA